MLTWAMVYLHKGADGFIPLIFVLSMAADTAMVCVIAAAFGGAFR